MKRILNRLAVLAAAICCAVGFVLPASAAREHENAIANCALYDPDGFFDEVDRESLSQLVRETSDEIDMYIAVCVLDVSGENMSDPASEAYADDQYDAMFNVQYGEESDGLLLLLNMPERYMYISTCGMGELYYYNGLSDDRISAMISNLTDYLRNEDYTGAVSRFCSDAKYYRDKGIPDNAYSYNSGNGMYAYRQNGKLVYAKELPWWFGIEWGFWIPCGVIVGALAGLIAFLIIKSSYQLKKSLNATNYISSKETHFYQQDDVFLRTHTTKHYNNPDRGSGVGGGGGGGSSHSSGGGFSHGGGGGHW